MPANLTGAAYTAQRRRLLIEEAEAIVAMRDPESAALAAALLVAAESKTPPRKKPAMDRLARQVQTWEPKAGPEEWLAQQRATDGPDATVLTFPTRYTGHGDGHTYRQDIRLSR